MPGNRYERLAAGDLQLLDMETPAVAMDMVSTQIYGPGRLSTPSGGVDALGYRNLVSAVLQRLPRYRQKLRWIPYADMPVWVDDPNFNIDYHIRHTALPHPGSLEQLKSITATVAERRLDRERPLWELWLVEGLPEGHYAIISKIHHCLLDEVGGLSLAPVLMSDEPLPAVPPWRPFVPAEPPSEVSLLWDEWQRRYSMPIDALRNAGEIIRRTRGGLGNWERHLGAMRESLVSIIRRPRSTPVNGEVGPHRRVDWLEMPMASLMEARSLLVCSLSDILLALLAGGVRALYDSRGIEPRAGQFKAAVPVRLGAERDHVTAWTMELMLERQDTVARVDHLAGQAAEFGGDDDGPPVARMLDPSSWAAAGFLALFRLGKEGCANTLFAPMAGPSTPLYSVGARMHAIFPHVPLQPGIGLTVAVISYEGRLCWSFNGDYDLLPDLDVVRRGVARTLDDLLLELGISAQPPVS